MIVNGQQQSQIPLTDRSIQYGDGCFTTIAYQNASLELFDSHIQRLKDACERLSIPFTNWEQLSKSVFDTLPNNESCVVKIMITRGSGGRGYSPVGAKHPNFIITHHSIPQHYKTWQTDGISVSVSPVKLARQPLLAGIKHLNRLEQVLIKQALATTEYDDVIVCDTGNEVIESSVGNVFWWGDEKWFTANLSESGVVGVMRNQIIKMMEKAGHKVIVTREPLEALFEAQALFVCNSLMGVVPVKSLIDPVTFKVTKFLIEPVYKVQSMLKNKLEN
ncbi:MAG: aminodeoxychorismate lyase [Paraglaciecola sp.]|uniref:aminodeoxychorismate lyase n=1 Tax=Paraglaciecola sp. TaxID=1920173 RepID=UPI003296B819